MLNRVSYFGALTSVAYQLLRCKYSLKSLGQVINIGFENSFKQDDWKYENTPEQWYEQVYHLPQICFLCGAAYSENEYNKTNRGIIDKYLKSKSEDIFIVLSEKLWEDNFDSNIDLLTFEEFLAEVSDAIILFVESPGPFCELGAFAYAEKLFSDKLIIVIDEKYEGDKSFIITGPTAKAQKDGAKVIYAPLSGTGLLSSADLRKIVDENSAEFASKSSQSNKRHPNKDETYISVNTFILELLELIKIVQPVHRRDLIDIYKEIKGFSAFKFVKKMAQIFTMKLNMTI